MIAKHIEHNKSKLTFTKGFSATRVVAKINNMLIWKDIISTSCRLGVAIPINFNQVAEI
ncbi:hypothetical protein [Patiriisocius marinus]|uniref:Uncharacterized protein n=1 Tax=Patiriisocius marinus TaxID=1397112 RepID=A0A5J4IYT6_9FLAO|nr:hypothetical protein [Patiriisocius marinus]GER58798.1 hypothetical protein ULMA_09060 [Patiriisocius marinus]